MYALEGEIYSKLKNIHLGKPPLILKKVFWFVYISLHSSTLVYIRFDSCSDSSTFVYVRLDSSSERLHSSTFVYTCLLSPSNSSVFLETDPFKLIWLMI